MDFRVPTSMIRFWAVHHKSMESHTLRWNGGLLASFLHKFNSKVSEEIPNKCISWSSGNLLPEDLDKVMLYPRNRAKLALSLLIIVEKCHPHGIQYNNLSPSNILLYFHPWTRQRFSWVCVIGGWFATLAKRLHQITVFKLLMKWKSNNNNVSMLHQSYFMFLGHVD